MGIDLSIPSERLFQQPVRDSDWLGPAVQPGEMLLEEFLKPMARRPVELPARA
jgi:hypothetical protein